MQNDTSLTLTISILAGIILVVASASGFVALPKMDTSFLWREKPTAVIEAPQPVRVKAVSTKPAETVCNGVMRGGFCVLDDAPTMSIR